MQQNQNPITHSHYTTLLSQLVEAKPEVKGTTLITYIVSGSTSLWLVCKHLTTEISTASNIKSKQVRYSVINALKSLSGSIELYCKNGKIPPNGLVMLAGSLSSPNSNEIPYYI